jgi:hypothetical protein
MTRYRAWVAMPYLWDHAPIFLQLEGDYQRKNFPFKLNLSWLKEADFSRIVGDIWKDTMFLQEPGLQRRLVWKLKCLKIEIKKWRRKYKKLLSHKLDVLEKELQIVYHTITSDWQNTRILDLIKTKENEMSDLLKEEEDMWRQKAERSS